MLIDSKTKKKTFFLIQIKGEVQNYKHQHQTVYGKNAIFYLIIQLKWLLWPNFDK